MDFFVPMFAAVPRREFGPYDVQETGVFPGLVKKHLLVVAPIERVMNPRSKCFRGSLCMPPWYPERHDTQAMVPVPNRPRACPLFPLL